MSFLFGLQALQSDETRNCPVCFYEAEIDSLSSTALGGRRSHGWTSGSPIAPEAVKGDGSGTWNS